jgi:hypothetical protein
MYTRSNKRKPDTPFIVLSKFPLNEPAPVSPTGHLWRELPVYRALSTYLNPYKNSLNKEMHPFS